MRDELQQAVENESEQDLIKCLDYRRSNEIDSNLYYLIEKALIGMWHSQHEDLVNIIYLANLKDDRFVEPIFNIAMNKEIFRWYDDELESTLRKCIHALKTIDSKKSNEALEKLKKTNNDNVKYALEMYK
ncbi:hypothetical protein FAZ19_18985 [Sphingobacterium alkalisoli]|uniref:HEAT repeat domain-containing protein n=1 Tax=Sphingobacterium alkalisoli TaxID=1874115 RepID=A0A4V6WF25_9SPHI|nr:hypothetical protein [Sphingobacterium alkalisoli]TJY62559.1 hypothetical protein FAZ19_18985 [Sphingobacterium alkalisoli]GGH27433.1 hypothetical protein GCM10011418_37370 [Sphingobacterium alkalisoli]